MKKTFVEIIAWNTGRCYSEMGQRVAAGYCQEDQFVYFADIDRGIFGKLKFQIDITTFHQGRIMQLYDEGKYTDDTTNETLMHCAGQVPKYINS